MLRDLSWVGLGILLAYQVFAVAAFQLGRRMGSAERRPRIAWGAACLAGVIFFLALRLRPDAALVLLPLEPLAWLEEVLPVPFALGVIGAALAPALPRRRRAVLQGLALLVFLYGVVASGVLVWPYDRSSLGSHTVNGVCLQSRDETCVAASLVTLLKELGRDATEAEMARETMTVPGIGSSTLRACRALRRRLPASEIRILRPASSREPLPTPCLVPIRYGFRDEHMVVLLDVRDGNYVVGDPMSGRCVWTHERFERRWTGIVIAVLEPGRGRSATAARNPARSDRPGLDPGLPSSQSAATPRARRAPRQGFPLDAGCRSGRRRPADPRG